VLFVAAMLLAACGSSNRLLTAADAQRAFRGEGFALRVVVDSRKLDQGQIDRLTHVATSDVGVVRAAKVAARASLEAIRARAVEHPVMWLASSSRPVELGPQGVEVLVWGRTADAKSNEAKAERGSGITGGSFGIVRVRNVVVI
jgi:hypothetical protein